MSAIPPFPEVGAQFQRLRDAHYRFSNESSGFAAVARLWSRDLESARRRGRADDAVKFAVQVGDCRDHAATYADLATFCAEEAERILEAEVAVLVSREQRNGARNACRAILGRGVSPHVILAEVTAGRWPA